MPIISAFPTGESTVDYTGPKSGLPSLEEGKVAYVTDEKRLYTGNADGTNTQIPNADDVKTDVSDAVSSHNSATDAHANKFAAVNAAIGNLTPSACKVTLTVSGWDSTAKTQSATVSGVLEDESKQLIMPMPAGTSMSAYNEAGIQMTAQGDNSVTFTADTVPKADIEVWVVVQAVNDVTPPPPALDEPHGIISVSSL